MEIRFHKPVQTRGPADAELPLPVARVPDLSGRILGGRYNLRRRIGGGSMGTVYEARDMTLGTAVAVKVMHPEYSDDEGFRKRFHQEALIGARLRHEHSVAVTDLGQSDDGLLYSVMEYLEGESLDALMGTRCGPLPWRRVVLIAAQVCAALQAAHDRGIIHRDIKPGNCFLVRREGRSGLADDDERDDDDHDPGSFTFIKVLDLGLARVMPIGGRPTPPGRLGAPEYLAPEQIQGSVCDHRVDLYSLGVMMFALLSGRLPFVGDSAAAVMRQHIEAPPPSLRRVAPAARIPAGLDAVVQRALAKDPAERFASATAMALAIRSAAADALTESIAIDEPQPDDAATGSWRRPAPPTTIPTMASITSGSSMASMTMSSMLIDSVFSYGPSARRGLFGLALAFVSICVAVTMLWTSDRLLLVAAAGDEPIDAQAEPQPPPPVAPRPRPVAPFVPLGPVDILADERPDLSSPPWIDPELEPAPDLADPTEPAEAATPAIAPRRRGEPPGALLGRAPLRTPGVPPERTFQRLVDSVAPGVHRCVRNHAPDLASLTIELTVGGPRSSAVELVLRDITSPELRACVAPLVARLNFPATERTARYAHTYRL